MSALWFVIVWGVSSFFGQITHLKLSESGCRGRNCVSCSYITKVVPVLVVDLVRAWTASLQGCSLWPFSSSAPSSRLGFPSASAASRTNASYLPSSQSSRSSAAAFATVGTDEEPSCQAQPLHCQHFFYVFNVRFTLSAFVVFYMFSVRFSLSAFYFFYVFNEIVQWFKTARLSKVGHLDIVYENTSSVKHACWLLHLVWNADAGCIERCMHPGTCV